MLSAAIDLLGSLGILPIFGVIATAVVAIFLFSYFTNRG